MEQIIEWCWHGKFAPLKDLAEKAKILPGVMEQPRAVSFIKDYCLKRKKECQDLIDMGFLHEN